jgi:hypothetical protein
MEGVGVIGKGIKVPEPCGKQAASRKTSTNGKNFL